ncbi:efflux RND transporter periplasmic adaptor subunit [Nitrospirillum iridis]|uniref:Multidrug efflux system membrane fusion protein n=1 Tax=Nitrospirillum iridis TaxID=765888 RepID=A0A7X0EDF3_9PROT|nr:efflux RND transporter periplasmic adaptor subunit [Nitrospirillum iridis]MBB6252045.1 multidrug efflux system membrane fusion protein [Nitrospirillum iridis]
MSKNPMTPPMKPLHISRTRAVMAGLGGLFILAAAGAGLLPSTSSKAAPPTAKGGGAVEVDTALAAPADAPIYLAGLGSVQSLNTVTVTTRVDGALDKIAFTEGQTVKPGDLLAQIDPRLYQAAYDQALATKAKDEAQLANARADLERYTRLAPQNLASKQTVDAAKAQVDQLVAQVKGDQAAIDNARTQLDYTRITSPIQGRTGIRMVDPGNNLHASSTTGIVVVTQMQPISVIFTLPEEDRLAVSQAMAQGPLTVTALSRDGKTDLASGTVMLVDNQIDPTTGTVRLKAQFANADEHLWPGQFVNVKLLRQTRRGALTIPTAALQRGPNGVYAYVVKPDDTVEMRPIETAETTGDAVVVTKGLQPGERVTTSNAYRLQPGAKVAVAGMARTADATPAHAEGKQP